MIDEMRGNNSPGQRAEVNLAKRNAVRWLAWLASVVCFGSVMGGSIVACSGALTDVQKTELRMAEKVACLIARAADPNASKVCDVADDVARTVLSAHRAGLVGCGGVK